ncbi:MAG: prepilin-type N-terminal cleavage/methylation domain-containing protein [Deltaproteobacteria bacterium]|nr:prepilin-type N-terminal cleavage/methylation domain-containing protein [Deltaproteobacteria bacterium]
MKTFPRGMSKKGMSLIELIIGGTITAIIAMAGGRSQKYPPHSGQCR